jgi:excisionase family DNA binding protein
VNVALPIPEELVEAIASRAAAIVLERLGERLGEAPSEFVTPEEAAELLGCSRRRIYDLRTQRRLTPYREGGRAMVRREELLALVARPALSLDERRRRVA